MATPIWGQVPEKEKVVAGAERAFEKSVKAYVEPAPGCAAAVSLDGQTVFEKGVTHYFPERKWTPTPAELAALKGNWFSEKAGATFMVAVDGDQAFLKQRPATSLTMQPLYKDQFLVRGGFIVWVTRDKSGRVDQLHAGASRMRDMPFVRMK